MQNNNYQHLCNGHLHVVIRFLINFYLKFSIFTLTMNQRRLDMKGFIHSNRASLYFFSILMFSIWCERCWWISLHFKKYETRTLEFYSRSCGHCVWGENVTDVILLHSYSSSNFGSGNFVVAKKVARQTGHWCLFFFFWKRKTLSRSVYIICQESWAATGTNDSSSSKSKF